MKLGKKDVVIILLAIALVVVILSGHSGSENKIVGCWRYVKDERIGRPDITYLEFYSDGTYVSNATNYDGKYSIDGNRIKLEGTLVKPKVYLFEIKGDVLTLYYYEGDEYPKMYKKEK